MAKKKLTVKETIPYSDWVWCLDNLSTAQLEKHDADKPSSDSLIDGLNNMIEAGFKITFKTDNYNGALIITAVCDSTGFLNSGLAISARSDDTMDMLSILLYKFWVVAQGDLRSFADKKPRGVRG